MKKSISAITAFLAVTNLAHSTILINEVHVNPPGADGNFEYIELKSANTATNAVIPNESTNGLYLLVIQTRAQAGDNPGVIRQAWNLNTFTTGSNGLMLLGDKYDELPKGGPWASFVPTQTPCYDPPGMGTDNIDHKDGMTILLVTGYNPVGVTLGVTDLDTNNDGTFDGAVPWTTIQDSVGFRDRNNNPKKTYALADVGNAQTVLFDPDNVSRNNLASGGTPNSVLDWYGGKLAGTISLSTAFSSGTADSFFFTTSAAASPGRPNQSANLPVAIFRINEVGLDPSGSDINYEYIEIKNVEPTNPSAALEGYHLLLIDSYIGVSSTTVGHVVEAWDLSGMATGSNGLLLLGDNYPNATPWKGYVDAQTQLGDPADTDALGGPNYVSKMDPGDVGDNDGFTLLLVRGWGSVSTEIVGLDFDPDDNSDTPTAGNPSAAITPSVTITDSIGFDQPAGAKTYAPGKVVSAVVPDNMSRLPSSTTANNGSTAHWYGGSYKGESPFSLGIDPTKSFGTFVGMGTPGRPNPSAAPAAPAPGTIVINEVNIDPPPDGGSDGNAEYVEIYSTTGTITSLNGVTLVGVNTTTATPSYKSLLVDLTGYTTGPNGLLLLGDSYNDSNPFSGQLGSSPHVDTAREDPQGLNAGEISPSDGLTVCLVGGSTMVKPVEAAPPVVINPASPPWTTLYDSVGFGAVPAQFGSTNVANVTQSGWNPDNLSRIRGSNAANSTAAWFGGVLDQTGGLSTQIYYGSQYFGTFKGAASPGRLNHTATPAADGLLFNEIHLDPPDGKEKTFIELISPTKGAQSCNTFAIVVIDSGGTDIGSIRHVWTLDGLSTGSNGLLLLGPSFSTTNPWSALTSPSTNVANPIGAAGTPDEWNSGDIIDKVNAGGITLLLVRDTQRYLKGYVPEDIDTVGGAANVGDGIIDASPTAWGSVSDSMTVKNADLTGTVYTTVGPGVVAKNNTQVGFTPDSMSRLRGNYTANDGGVWFGGDIINEALGVDSTRYDAVERFGSVVGRATPGGHNGGADNLDEDKDGINNLMEDALGLNPNANDSNLLPTVSIVTNSGQNYLALTFREWVNGAGVQGASYASRGYLYEVQSSPDLTNWATYNTIQGSPAANADGTQTLTIRSLNPLINQGREFMRLKITRQ